MANDLSAVTQPVATARGLPNAHYVDDLVFEQERHAVLFDNWMGLTFGREIPDPGDVIPIDLMGMPLIALRDKAGQVRVYQNTCRHRGMILVEARKNISGVIRCPYHSWCYGTDGRLVTTPHVGGPGQNTDPNLDRATLGLVEIRSHVWRDIVFVNVSGTAPDFEDYAASTIARWAEFEDQSLFPAGQDSSFQFDIACNWKLAVENYCESYHLPWVHPGLNSYSRLEDHYNIVAPDHSGQGTLVYRPMMSDDGQRFPDFNNLSEKWDASGEYIALYPNVLLGVHRDHAFAIILEPKAKDRTVEHVALYYAASDVEGPQWADMRAKNAALWHQVFKEDIFVVEGMQRGRSGIHFDGGKFSPAMDAPTHNFHAWVASKMNNARNG